MHRKRSGRQVPLGDRLRQKFPQQVARRRVGRVGDDLQYRRNAAWGQRRDHGSLQGRVLRRLPSQLSQSGGRTIVAALPETVRQLPLERRIGSVKPREHAFEQPVIVSPFLEKRLAHDDRVPSDRRDFSTNQLGQPTRLQAAQRLERVEGLHLRDRPLGLGDKLSKGINGGGFGRGFESGPRRTPKDHLLGHVALPATWMVQSLD